MVIESSSIPAVGRGAAGARLSSWGLFTLFLGAALPMIDFFIVNVALPTINSSLHASTTTLELVIGGYALGYSLLLVMGGRLGDTFGRRRLFMIGMAAFTLTSLACGLAPSASILVLARVLQGAAAAMMAPQVLSTVQATTTGQRKSRALGIYGAVVGLSVVAGQLLGGVMVSANIGGLTWRPIFLINVPTGLIGLWLARRTVPATRSANPATLDLPGTAVFGATMLALLIPLTEGRSLGWPLWTWLLLAAVPVGAFAFVRVEQRAERAGRVPLLPPSILRLPSMRRGLAFAVPYYLWFPGFIFVYALTLQDGVGMGPFAAGFAVVPLALAFFAISLVSAKLVARIGTRVIVYGLVLLTLGVGLTIGATLLYWPHLTVLILTPGLVCLGLANGLAVTTIARVVLLQVPAERAGVGSGLLATSQQGSTAVGVAVLGTLFVSLDGAGGMGIQGAFVVVLAVIGALAVGLVFLGLRLPELRRKPRERTGTGHTETSIE
jgi:MFS family permease